MIKDVFKKYINPKDQSHEREVISKSYINLIIRLFGRGLNYLVVFFIISIFGKEDFGKWVLLTTIFLVTQLITSFGIKVSIVRYFAEYLNKQINLKDLYKKALITVTISSLAGIAVLYLLSDYFSVLFGKDYVAGYIRIIAWGILPLNYIELHADIYRGMRKIFMFSFYNSFILPLVLILLLSINFFFSQEIEWLFYLYITSLTSVSIFSFIIIYNTFRKTSDYLSGEQIVSYKELISISLPMFLTSSFSLINRWADIIILGLFCSDVLIGAYGLAVRLSNIIPLSLLASDSVSASKIRELYVNKNFSEMKNVIEKSGKFIFWLGLIPGLVLIFGGNYALSFFDSEYHIALWSLIFLSFSQLINVFTGSTYPLLNMTGAHNLLFRIAFISAVLNIILNFWLIQLYGITGAAIATGAATIINNLLCVLFVKKKLGFYPFYLPYSKK